MHEKVCAIFNSSECNFANFCYKLIGIVHELRTK